MERNKKNILALAKLIEALPEEKFDMQDTRMNCGSPSCIAGWAAWEQQGRPKFLDDNQNAWTSGTNNLVNSALKYFGIEEDGQYQIMSELFRGEYRSFDNAMLTKEDAVEALREFARTGEIVWPE